LTDYLTPILERKRREVARRQRHTGARGVVVTRTLAASEARWPLAHAALRRAPGKAPRVIAEIKRRSPSAGAIRPWSRGDVAGIARDYVAGGASAISVLCDRAGFGGSVLDLRRAARTVSTPLLFKEFVLEELQITLAARAGAHMVLLLVRALTREQLHRLCDAALRCGLAPVVEAADGDELERALETSATIIGVNARDLKTFKVDPQAAQRALQRIPPERIAVHMSGIHHADDYRAVAAGRADAVLIGESLMRAHKPADKLRELLAPAPAQHAD
jgi:indole-3-glycerol phosphate synthase